METKKSIFDSDFLIKTVVIILIIVSSIVTFVLGQSQSETSEVQEIGLGAYKGVKYKVGNFSVMDKEPFDLVMVNHETKETILTPFEEVKFVKTKLIKTYSVIHEDFAETKVIYVHDESIVNKLLGDYTYVTGKTYSIGEILTYKEYTNKLQLEDVDNK